jgi:hypothetical protein
VQSVGVKPVVDATIDFKRGHIGVVFIILNDIQVGVVINDIAP